MSFSGDLVHRLSNPALRSRRASCFLSVFEENFPRREPRGPVLSYHFSAEASDAVVTATLALEVSRSPPEPPCRLSKESVGGKKRCFIR